MEKITLEKSISRKKEYLLKYPPPSTTEERERERVDMRRKRRRASSSFSSSSFSSRRRRALEIVFVFASLMSVFLSCVFATPRGDENNNNNNNNNAFDYLRDALLMSSSSSSSNGGFETTGDGENRIWNVVQSFGENQESWAALQEAYVRIGRLSSHDGASMTTTGEEAFDAGRDAFLNRLMQGVVSGSYGDGSLLESFAQTGGEDGFFSGKETFLTRMLQDIIESGGEGAIIGDGTFANRLIDNLNAIEPREALRSLINAIQETGQNSDDDDNSDIVQSLSGIETSSLPLSDEIREEISRRLQIAAENFNLTLSEPGNYTSEEVRLLGEKIIENAILTSRSDNESTAVSFESRFAPPLREVFLNFFSASIASSSSSNNVTTDALSNQSNTALHLLVNDAISDAMDSAVRFASDIFFLNTRNSTSTNTDEVMALYDRVIGIMSSSRDIFTQVLADAAETTTSTTNDDDRESDTLRRAQQLLEAFRGVRNANGSDQVQQMSGDELFNAGLVKDRIIYPPPSSKHQTSSKRSGTFNERAKKLLIAFSTLFVALFITIGIFNRFCSKSAELRRVNMIIPETSDLHVNEHQSSSISTGIANDGEGSPPNEQNKEAVSETTLEQATAPSSSPKNRFVVRKSSLVRRAPSAGIYPGF